MFSFRTRATVRLAVAALIMALLQAGATRAAGLRVVTVDETRAGTVTNGNGSFNFNFLSGPGFAQARDLVSSAYASMGPTTFSAVNDLEAVSRANADVIVLPLMTGASYGTSYFRPEEVDSVRAFLNDGGGLIAFSNHTPTDDFYRELFGVNGQSTPLIDPNPVTVNDPIAAVSAGPFGKLGANSAILAASSGKFTDLGTGTALLQTADGSPFAGYFQQGEGKAILFADEELFIDSAEQVTELVRGQLEAGSTNATLLKNALAAISPVPVPEVGPVVVLLLGFGGLVARRRLRG